MKDDGVAPPIQHRRRGRAIRSEIEGRDEGIFTINLYDLCARQAVKKQLQNLNEKSVKTTALRKAEAPSGKMNDTKGETPCDTIRL
jgi:hypothetical protein